MKPAGFDPVNGKRDEMAHMASGFDWREGDGFGSFWPMPHSADPRIDAYISQSAVFARPILAHLRSLVHRAVPQVEETIKWGMPFFTLGGTPLCHMAAFKAHAAFGFWRRDVTEEFEKHHANGQAMGAAGRITGLKDLPADKVILTFLRQAAERTLAGLPPRPKRRKAPRRPVRTPSDLAAALRKKAKAAATWEGLSYSHRKDYAEWITEAKRPETRAKRLAAALDLLSAGKTRNWKYDRC